MRALGAHGKELRAAPNQQDFFAVDVTDNPIIVLEIVQRNSKCQIRPCDLSVVTHLTTPYIEPRSYSLFLLFLQLRLFSVRTELSEIRNDIRNIPILCQAGEGHTRTRNHGPGRSQIAGQRLLIPHETRFFGRG